MRSLIKKNNNWFSLKMHKKKIKWIIYLAAPLLLLCPLSQKISLSKYFTKVVLHPQKTGITTLHLYDIKRSRPVVTEIWYPIDSETPFIHPLGIWVRCGEARDAELSKQKKTYPLIVLSHGHGGDRFNIAWLAEVLAANGYIVASMDHYGNTWNNKIPEYYLKTWERPKDISFVIDQILQNSLFQNRIDPTRIGFSGYSLGATTGLWIAGACVKEIEKSTFQQICNQHLGETISLDKLKEGDFQEVFQSFQDQRISAFFVMAPALGWMFTEQSLKNIQPPFYIVASEQDEIAPTEQNAQWFAKIMNRVSLKILKGNANHYTFLNRATSVGKRFLHPRFYEDPQGVDRKKIQETLAKEAVLFFNQMP